MPKRLSVYKIAAVFSLRIFLEQSYKKFGVGPYIIFITVVSVDKHQHIFSGHLHLCALVVACRSAHTSCGITIHGQSGYVEHSAAYTLIRFAFTPDTERERVADKLVCVKATDAVAIGNACKIYKVYQRVNLI